MLWRQPGVITIATVYADAINSPHGILGCDGSSSLSSSSAFCSSSSFAGKFTLSAALFSLSHDILIPPSCITARRRRKAGRTPFYGTGWAARPGNNNAQPYYGNQNSAPAPPYTGPTNNNNNGYYNGGANQGYYGQQNGVELQSPQATYGGNQQYAPPPGPPPAKY